MFQGVVFGAEIMSIDFIFWFEPFSNKQMLPLD